METLAQLLTRLRVQRALTQNKLAERASCSLSTITDIEQGRPRRLRPGTALAIYTALASPPHKPLSEADAALFFKLTGLSPTVAGGPDAPLMLDDVTWMQELARERIVYEPDRPRSAHGDFRTKALQPATHEGVTVTIPQVVLQLVANLIAAHGPARTEELLRSVAAMAQPPAPSPGAVPPGFVKTPPVVSEGYSVSEVIPTAPRATKLEKGTGPAARSRRSRGG